jgi:hypothetical protein
MIVTVTGISTLVFPSPIKSTACTAILCSPLVLKPLRSHMNLSKGGFVFLAATWPSTYKLVLANGRVCPSGNFDDDVYLLGGWHENLCVIGITGGRLACDLQRRRNEDRIRRLDIHAKSLFCRFDDRVRL